ncbi:hypothetical protein L083_2169 [Actinoplanes sp. N902-109]|nr:hypothetical protein L083_2169 [Actinoplanes sp. N902-109]
MTARTCPGPSEALATLRVGCPDVPTGSTGNGLLKHPSPMPEGGCP